MKLPNHSNAMNYCNYECSKIQNSWLSQDVLAVEAARRLVAAGEDIPHAEIAEDARAEARMTSRELKRRLVTPLPENRKGLNRAIFVPLRQVAVAVLNPPLSTSGYVVK